jgi:hypothetical protein
MLPTRLTMLGTHNKGRRLRQTQSPQNSASVVYTKDRTLRRGAYKSFVSRGRTSLIAGKHMS